MTALTKPSTAVIDTNVVLDWFVYRNPGVAPIADAIEHQRLRWLSCAEMLAELRHVLTHASLGRRAVDAEHVLTSATGLSALLPLPSTLPAVRLRCSDASDQMFVDLALEHGADWLLTRDRALLKLARKAALRGLRIATPEAWQDIANPAAP